MGEILSFLKDNPSLTAIVAYFAVKEIISYFKDSTRKNIEATEINTRTLIRVETEIKHFEKTLEDLKKTLIVLDSKYSKHESDIRNYNARIKQLEGK